MVDDDDRQGLFLRGEVKAELLGGGDEGESTRAGLSFGTSKLGLAVETWAERQLRKDCRGLSYDLGMPCDCVLDTERRLVRCRAWGLVTYVDVMAARLQFTSDPNFRPDFYQLYDGREVTRMALTASEIGLLARDDIFGSRSRRAFVAPSQETYAMMRLFQTYRSINAGKEADPHVP